MRATFLAISILLSACSAQNEGELNFKSRSSLITAASESDVESLPAPLNNGSHQRGSGRPSAHLTPYLGATYQQVAAASAVAGAGLDGEIALSYADDICALDLEEAHSNERSLEDLRRFKNTFCANSHGGAGFADRQTAIERAADRGSVEASILQIALNAASDMTRDELDHISEELSSLRSTTQSPYVFYTASEILYSEPLYDASLDRDRPAGMNDETLRLVRQYGAMLAGCDIFKHCAANSLMAKRVCLPTQCAPGQDVRGYVRRQLPEDAYLEAVKFSRYLTSEYKQM